jgi:hypothetical protein
MRRRAAVLLALVLLAGTALVTGYVLRDTSQAGGRARTSATTPDAVAPEGTRIRVEVLNATRTRGLARRATMHLRDRGFDVVYTANSGALRDSTLVLDRSGHAEWAALVARAMGGAPTEARPDSSRYVDVTVLVGASWRAPAEPFYP